MQIWKRRIRDEGGGREGGGGRGGGACMGYTATGTTTLVSELTVAVISKKEALVAPSGYAVLQVG